MSGVTVEVHFAQRLASNEKTIRDKTIKKLRLWMTVRSKSGKHAFTEEDFLKLWKGLFYCMWMCDKALVQEELADNIVKLVQKLHTTESALMFFKTFLKTMEREWHGIDRLRMDKFYMFIRRMLREQLESLKSQQWNRESIGALLEILKQGPLNATNPTKATGLLHHIADIYLEELTRVGATELSPQETLLFLDPFITLISQTKNKSLMKTLLREIFEDIMVHSTVGMEEIIEQEKMMAKKQNSENEEEEGEDGEEDESDEEDASLAFDFSAIADQLFTFGSRKDTPGLNRKKMYGMAQKFQDLAKGIYPIPDLEELAQLSSDDEIEDDVKLKHKRKQKKKMREAKLKMKMEKDADNVVGEMNDGEEEKAKKESMMNGNLHVKRKKKLKEKLGEIEENSEVDGLVARKLSKKKRTLKDVDENKVEVMDIVKDNKKVKKCKKSTKLQELDNKQDLEIKDGSGNLKNIMDKKKTKIAAKRKSESYVKQTEEPFAAFQAVSTPPAVVLKKRVEPVTEVRSKKPIKLTAPGSAPPGIKKHVKITLSKNTKHKQSDYQKQIKCSPGIPFDSTKKPTHSVLKRTAMTTPVKTTHSVLKRTAMTTPKTKIQTKKHRSNASDFF